MKWSALHNVQQMCQQFISKHFQKLRFIVFKKSAEYTPTLTVSERFIPLSEESTWENTCVWATEVAVEDDHSLNMILLN